MLSVMFFAIVSYLYNIIKIKELQTSCFYYCILLNNAMVKSTDREGRKQSAWGWNAKCHHGGEMRTFVLKPLPNKDITV